MKFSIKILITLLFLMLLSGCRQEPQFYMVHENALIFSARYAEEIRVPALYKGEEIWTPSVDDVLKLEEALPAYLQENAHLFYKEPYAWEALDKYQRQYVGYLEDGKRMIYGNFFCFAARQDWQANVISVEDGGECFFQVWYDTESGTFFKMIVNGEA